MLCMVIEKELVLGTVSRFFQLKIECVAKSKSQLQVFEMD